MNVTDHLEPLIAVTAIASTAAVLLLLMLAVQLLRGRLRRAAGSLAVVAVLALVGFAASVPLATAFVGMPSP
ncbi:hypothetical protein J2X03_000731 [Microbacterium trichothecenolyticum]|uniref:hypothetical protein n=1 Tax=Microbacterium trichothecenolyticum TaxID=69370 RepID=UPI002856B024|nr:hypothetical protein [Microbacterium trichothecenolyticum]MDR7110875.1 hypothetical protein [Microbacterium trichothecenolyticum]